MRKEGWYKDWTNRKVSQGEYRLDLWITKEQHQLLQDLSSKSGIPMAATVRRLINEKGVNNENN